MAKNIRRMLAMVLVLCMTLSALPMQALAAEDGTTTETTTEDGVTTTVEATQTTTTDTATGNTTITVEITQSSSGTQTSTGAKVNGSGSSTEYTVTDSDNNFVSSEGSGSATTTTTSTSSDGTVTEVTVESGFESEGYIGDSPIDLPPVEGLPTVEFKEGDTEVTITTPLETPATSVSGDLPEDESDNIYDYTKVTVDAVDRTVTGTLTTGESVVIDPFQSNLECPVDPTANENKDYYEGTGNYRDGLLGGFSNNFIDTDYGYVTDKPEDSSDPNKPGFDSGYDMTWTGYGDITDGAVAVFVKEAVYMTDENGEVIYENGYPVLDMEESVFVNGKNGKADGTGMVSQSVMFALRHENENYFYAYCMDASTGANPDINDWYQIRNLEDAIESDENPDGYLTKEEAGKIRAIAQNGYWGTESSTGSIDSMKELLRNTYTEDTIINVRYPGSNESHPHKLSELIDGLTDAEALAVTQAAIWTYANNGDVTYNQGSYGGVVTNASVVGVLSAFKFNDSSGVPGLNEYKPAKDSESDARMQALYQALLGLTPIYEDGSTQEKNNVIPSKDVINDVTVAISDKVAGDACNEDEDTDNDVYSAAVNFTLAFVPDKDSDDLLVALVKGYDKATGEPVYMTDANGDPIIRRLAGENSEGETYGAIEADDDGVYTLTGLQLGEGIDHTFDIRLEGTQYLENGVYIYQAFDTTENDTTRKASQTLVGMAQGSQHVTVTNSLTFSFNVDEQNHVVVEKHWSEETVEVIPPAPDTPVPTNLIGEGDPAPQPQIFRLNNQNEELEEIPEEPVPLAAPVVTGDNSFLWIAVVLLSLSCMVAVNIFDKKNQHEAF